jgi:hypothetical protein
VVVVATVVDGSALGNSVVVSTTIEVVVVVVASGFIVVSDKTKVVDSKTVAVAMPWLIDTSPKAEREF